MKERDIAYDGAQIEWDQRHIHSANTTFGQISYNPGGYCGPRTQLDFELILIHSGSCQVTVDHETYPMQMDKIYLFKPGHRERFVYSATQKTHHFWCSVSPQALPRAMRKSLLNVSEEGGVPSECFHRLISAAFLLSMTDSEGAQDVVDLLGQALFAEFLHIVRHVHSSSDLLVHRVQRYMEDHLAEEQCLCEAKRLSGYSETAFIYKFKQATGHTPSRYLWQMRTEKGIQLLSETGLSISEIAYRCGFKNPFHFSRNVRKLQGVSPRMLRHAAWK
jgi:AraC family transcriptional regulator of arabinose operon